MYEFIEGKVVRVTVDAVVISNNGIGYLIFCPNPYQFSQNEVITIFTHHYVREDAIHLYGFKSREERHLFVRLLGVSGIGPKGALAILATGEPGRVVEAIEEEDERYLTQFPGIGKKTARQIILDLKGKVSSVSLPKRSVTTENVSNDQRPLEEAVQALQALGYSEKEIGRISPDLKKLEGASTEAYIKQALQMLLKG